VDVVSLTAGNPTSRPPHISRRLRSGHRGRLHTLHGEPGTAELIEAVIDKFSSDNDLHFSPDQVLFPPGEALDLQCPLRDT